MIAANEYRTIRQDASRLDFRIGDVDVCVQSDLAEVVEDLAVLYGGCSQDGPTGNGPAIRMEVRRSKRSLFGGSEYVVSGDGEPLWSTRRRCEVLPYVEWGINWRLIATRPEYLQLHAATLSCAGQGLLLAGESGFGKSTLAAALMARGWSYLSDEFALIEPGTLQLHPFPKALCIKSGSFGLVERLDLPLRRRRHYVKALKGRVGYVSPHEAGPNVVADPCPVRWIVFPRYDEGQEPQLYPISRAQAAMSLAGFAFNRQMFGERATSILGDVVRGARCFGMRSGPIDETCDLIESLVQDSLRVE